MELKKLTAPVRLSIQNMPLKLLLLLLLQPVCWYDDMVLVRISSCDRLPKWLIRAVGKLSHPRRFGGIYKSPFSRLFTGLHARSASLLTGKWFTPYTLCTKESGESSRLPITNTSFRALNGVNFPRDKRYVSDTQRHFDFFAYASLVQHFATLLHWGY